METTDLKYFNKSKEDLDFIISIYAKEIDVRNQWIRSSFSLIGESINRGKGAVNTMRHAMDVIGHAVVIYRVISGAGSRNAEKPKSRERVSIITSKYPELLKLETPHNLNNVRNHYEHFDTKLDEWATTSENLIIVDMNVSPYDALMFASDLHENLRSLDPITTDLIFWGKKVNLRSVVDWANEVANIVNDERSTQNEDLHRSEE